MMAQRDEIAVAVARLRDLVDGPSALPEVIALGSAAVPALEALLRGSSESVSQPRRLAAMALGVVGTSSAKAALRRAMDDGLERLLDPVLLLSEDEVVGATADAIAIAPEPEDGEVLRRALRRRSNPGVVRALGKMRDPAAIPLFVRCLGDAMAQEPAAEALRSIGPLAVPAVTVVALTPSRDHGQEGAASVRTRARAIEVLGRIGSTATELPLAWALSDPEHEVRLAAALALTWRGPPDAAAAIPVLVEALADERWLVAEEAAAALATLGAEAMCGVRRWIRHHGGAFRERGARVLQRIPHRSATAALVRLSTDGSAAVRLAVAGALDGRKEPAARRALDRLADDLDPAVRARARSALHGRSETAHGLLARLRVRRRARRGTIP